MKQWLTQAGKFRVEKFACPHPSAKVDLHAPRKGVLHTTEGSFESALQVFRQHYAPTFMVGRDRSGHVRILQFLPLGDMAAALQNHYGGVETNSVTLVQIEIVGYSRKNPWLPDKDVREALVALMATLSIEVSIPLRHTEVNRDPKLWTRCAGWFGHDDVPENSHWDPGNLIWGALLSEAASLERQLYVTPKMKVEWPVPVPVWFWQWAEWRMGVGPYKDFGAQAPALRDTTQAPVLIPEWAWKRLKSLQSGRG